MYWWGGAFSHALGRERPLDRRPGEEMRVRGDGFESLSDDPVAEWSKQERDHG